MDERAQPRANAASWMPSPCGTVKSVCRSGGDASPGRTTTRFLLQDPAVVPPSGRAWPRAPGGVPPAAPLAVPFGGPRLVLSFVDSGSLAFWVRLVVLETTGVEFVEHGEQVRLAVRVE
jgi:hypothetical protein